MTLFTNKDFVFLIRPGKRLALQIAVSFLTVITILYGNVASAQNARAPLRASGLVTDISTGETLVGATVKVQGRNTGVSVDRTGHFLIDVPNENAVLLVTFVGYTEQKVPLEGKTVLDIK